MKKLYIIGGGPAGVSAALYAKRANIDTTILYLDKTSLNKAHRIDNYYGSYSLSGQEIYENGLKQAKELGIDLIKSEVMGIEFAEENYKISTSDSEYFADAIIIASGSERKKPAIANLRDFEGRGVSYCAVCDGFFYRKKKVAVLGNDAYAYHEADYLRQLADVCILCNGKELNDERLKEFTLYPQKISRLEGNDYLEKIIFDDNNILEINGLFVAEGSAGSTDLARKLGLMIENDNIIVNDKCETNAPGIFAAGDCTGGLLQIAKAVYEGAVAANSAIAYLHS